MIFTKLTLLLMPKEVLNLPMICHQGKKNQLTYLWEILQNKSLHLLNFIDVLRHFR